jgi:hypothetical protein
MVIISVSICNRKHIKDWCVGRMSVAQGIEAKEIFVKLVDRDEDGARTEHSVVTRRIDTQHTIQQAVRDVYPEFPGALRWVVLKRAGTVPGVYAPTDMDMWDSTQRGARLWALSWYDTINAGDTVEIHVFIAKPPGPRSGLPAFEGGMVLENGDEARNIDRAPGGPLAAQMDKWLGDLRILSSD